jgi:phage antirepressor YoqD-like protein
MNLKKKQNPYVKCKIEKSKSTQVAVQERKIKFLKLLEQNKPINEVCDSVQIKIQTYKRWLLQDKFFKQRVMLIQSNK